MKKYKLLGGGVLQAETNRAVVEFLNNTSLFGYEKNIDTFMEKTSAACRWQNGSVIRFEDVDTFVEDLIASGFLTEIEE